jgi:hypothetical protein
MRSAVIIPIYKTFLTASEEFSLRNTAEVLGNHNLFIVGPEKFKSELTELNEKLNLNCNLKLYSNQYFKNIAGYNKLLTSALFYRSFSDYEYILIAQTDVLVFSDQLQDWCVKEYSYMGAPWFNGFSIPLKPLEYIGVGNGGFSLRKVKDFIEVLSKPKRLKTLKRNYRGGKLAKFIKSVIDKGIYSYNFQPFMPRFNEDVFWGIVVPNNFDFFSVPTLSNAIPFAFEAEPQLLYELNGCRLPFGCHDWEKYDFEFWKKILLKHGFKLPPWN